MRSAILMLSLIGFQATLFAQNEMIELKNEHVDLHLKNFYIEKVIDGRTNKENIGFVQKGAFNRKINADLKGGVEAAVYNYLSESVVQDTHSTPVVMRVVYLNISEHTGIASETGKAEIKVEFYKKESNELGKLYETEAFVEKPGMDVTKGHEKRIREVLVACLKSFNNSEWEKATPAFEEAKAVAESPVEMEGTSFSNVQQEAPVWNSLLTFNKTWGVNADGWGLTYYGYTINKKSDWIIPWVISLERYTIDPEYFSQWGYQEAQFSYYMPGLSAFKKLNKNGNLYSNFTFMIPLGSEKLTDFRGEESTHFIIGLAPTQGLYFIPKSKFGITFGLGIYERLLTSKVYKSDIGIKAEMGIKF